MYFFFIRSNCCRHLQYIDCQGLSNMWCWSALSPALFEYSFLSRKNIHTPLEIPRTSPAVDSMRDDHMKEIFPYVVCIWFLFHVEITVRRVHTDECGFFLNAVNSAIWTVRFQNRKEFSNFNWRPGLLVFMIIRIFFPGNLSENKIRFPLRRTLY